MAPAKPKHDRLIRGNWNRLNEEQKKRAVKLNDDYYIIYPIELTADKFKMMKTYADKKNSALKSARNEARQDLKKEIVLDDFKQKNLSTSKLMLNGSTLLERDWRFMVKASPEMLWVKKSLAALNNILNESIKDYISENGVFDSDKYAEKVNQAYEEFFIAADNYLKNRAPGSSAGKRRYRRVEELLLNAKKSKQDFNVMIETTKEGTIQFEQLSVEERESINANNFVNKIPAKVTSEVIWQNEGNSTDVYRVTIVGEDGKHYYIKENLPFLNENMAGFLKRRIRQLNVSSQNHFDNPNPDLIEERLANITKRDYEIGLKLLNNLNDAINSAPEAEKEALGKKFAKYFAYNFDTLFRDLEIYNNMVDMQDLEGNLTLDEMIEKAHNEDKVILEQGLKLKKKMLEVQGVQNPGGKKPERMQKMTAYQFIQNTMGLKNNEDKEIIDSIKDLNDKELETLFRVTMGKEVELFGQMSAQKEQKGEDKAAINNTATSRVAEHLGFTDVITKSQTSLVKFKRRDGTTVNQLCTVCEAAEGREFIDLMKTAEKEGVKLIYSSEAIRNLIRLQAIDTLCLQKDRHGRNFKCEFDRDPITKNIIIKTIKAYDNDMSFDAIDLKTAFNEDSKDPKKLQFLPSMTMKVSKDSALYKHILGNYFGVDVVSPLNIPSEPILGTSRNQFNLDACLTRGPGLFIDNNETGINFPDDFYNSYDTKNIKYTNKLTPALKEKYIKEMEELGIKYDPKEDHKCFEKFISRKLHKISTGIKDLWYLDKKARKDLNEEYKRTHNGENRPNRDLPYNFNISDDDRIKLKAVIDEAKELQSAFDFTSVGHTYSTMTRGLVPYADIFLKTVTYTHDIVYGDSIEKRMLEQMKAQGRDYEAAKSLFDKQGNIIVPTLLHYDNEAYEKLKQAVNDYNDPNSVEVNKLKKLGMSEEKIAAIVTRDREMLKHLEDAKINADNFYKAAGWTEPPKNKFFLDKADYKELGDLTDFAIDPGKTYLAIDNENYLAGQTFMMKDGDQIREVKYTELMNDVEKGEAIDYNKYIQEDKKRWKYKEDEKNFKKYDVSNTGKELATATNSKLYITACVDDIIYSIGHDEIKSKEELVEKFKDVLFTERMITDQPLNMQKVKELMKPDSQLRKAFNNDLKSEEGKIFLTNLTNGLNGSFANQNYKKINNKIYDKIKKQMFDLSIENVFDKIKDPNAVDKNAVVEGIIDLSKKMETFAKNFGVNLNTEQAFNKYLEANQDVFTPEQINKIKNEIKPKAPNNEIKQNNPQANVIGR